MNPALSAEARAPYLLKFSELNQKAAPPWLSDSRRAAFDAFVGQSWPNRKQEDWRFTDVTPITEMELLPVPDQSAPIDPALFDAQILGMGGVQSHRMVFVDGHFHFSQSDGPDGKAGLRLQRLLTGESGAFSQLGVHFGQHLRNTNAFVALNTVFAQDGALVWIPPGLHCERTIYLVHLAVSAEGASFPRTLIVAGANSSATVVEVHLGARGRVTMCNAASEVVLEPGAQLAYHTVQKSDPKGFHLGHVAVTQQSGSAFSGHGVVLDGRLIRRDVQVLLAGEGCTCNLDGIYLVGGDSHVDNQTTIDHCQARSTSREDFRGAVTDKGHAVFGGRILVRPGADKTDAQQSNRNLLLSDTAQIDSKPQLEILTSDVKCSHGATTGRLDPESLFYLQTRGLDKRSAERILIRAFLMQGLERVASTEVRAELGGLLESHLDGFMTTGGRP
jgi:Fe-S cluster assembly protein SufD